MFSLFITSLAFQSTFVLAKGGVPAAPKPKPIKVKPGCGTSGCDSDMFKTNSPNFGYHVPNLNQLTADVWSTNVINGNKLETLNRVSNTLNVIKYGGFCAGSQKIAAFKGAFVPAGIPDPSWIANVPVGDVDVSGNLKPGSYKIDITQADLLTMNNVATQCQNICKGIVNCKFAHYGWEAPGGWFCKTWTNAVCTDSLNNWWKPAPPAFGVDLGAAPPSVVPIGGGCRVTDTIATTTPLLNPGTSWGISPSTPYTLSLPYVSQASYTTADGIVASIKCDVAAGGLTLGWPTFGTIWV